MARKKVAEKTPDEELIQEAKDRFARCVDRESETRARWKEDLRFANGDADNGYQWDDAMRKSRELDKRPCLTINKVKQHNRQITNDARQNKPSVRVYPVDDGADKKTAEIFNGIIRHIEANSSADTAYDTASEFAVDAGLGYWRITTDYAAEDTFDQEIYIKRIKNPLSVYLDPDIQEADGSDAGFGFVFEDISKEEFEKKYPDFDAISWPIEGGDDWLRKDTLRLCEYLKIVESYETLVASPDGQTFKLSEIEDKEMAKAIKADPSFKKRKVCIKKGKWFLIAGDQIVERQDWLGKYIPIVRVVGDEVEIDGKIERKGHTRGMKDAQRMYNFWTTSAVEFVALQGKQPYLAPAEAIAGYEEYWDNLNSSNLPYLPYNSLDGEGAAIASPVRQQPPTMAQAYMQGMQVASEEMKMASGQYDASMGAKSNETSGRAIMARQREGDNATFHFIDNVARAIKYTGKILVDLIPKIYDTERVVRILGEDGNEDKAHIDPKQPQAYAKTDERDPTTGAIKEIYNPSVGRYDVIVTVGPSYGTKRQEAFQALTEMSSRNPKLIDVAGDIIMRAADFPMAEQLAERLEKTLPPGLADKDENAEQQVQTPEGPLSIAEAGQAITMLHQQTQQMQQALQDKDKQGQDIKQQELAIKDKEADTKQYQAETQRMTAVAPAISPEDVAVIVKDTLHQILTSPPVDEPDPPQGMPQLEPAPAGIFSPEQTQ